MASDARPPISAALAAFGLAATVTPPGEPAVQTTAIWIPPRTSEVPTGADYQRAEQKRVIALPLAGLPAVPRGTVVRVSESLGAPLADWRVDEAERLDFDHYRALVIPV